MVKQETLELNLKTKQVSTKLEVFAKIAVDLPILVNEQKYFWYKVPADLVDDLQPGIIVKIPFGRQEINGFVIGIANEIPKDEIPAGLMKIKTVFEIVSDSVIWSEKYIKLANWMSKHYLTNIGTVLSSSITSDLFKTYSNEVKLINKDINLGSLTPEQQIIISKLLNSKNKEKKLTYKTLLQKTKITKAKFYSILNSLKNKGVIETSTREKKTTKLKKEINTHEKFTVSGKDESGLILNDYQKKAFESISGSINKNEYKPYLLHGVTGSGKTEVYIRLIEEVLKKGKTAIYLVPEIYLVPQIYTRITNRFNPEEVIIWHSSLTKNERLSNWEKLSEGKVKIIIGARSAILAPINNLGIIIVDEAHESTFKQSSKTPRYDAIKVAYKRGEIENCPVVLGTATPNINDYYTSASSESILELPERIKDLPMPKVEIIDLREEYPRTFKNIISNALRSAIKEALDKKEQIILLLNRRGYANNIICKACGYTLECKRCSVPMVFHKNLGELICHHCGFSKKSGKDLVVGCPECESIHFQPFGVGTQQLEEEVKKSFPEAKVIRVDKDQLNKKDGYINLWNEFSSGKADILIGTQLVAKGLDLPNVTVVGAISADTMLNFPDYVSFEKAFQLLTQVTGRAGRGEKPGRVFVQTYKADEHIFNYIKQHDYSGFYKSEIKNRSKHIYPPFTNLTRIIFQSFNEKDCLEYANEIIEVLDTILNNLEISPEIKSEIKFLGPAPCFFSKLHGKYRYHILCKIQDDELKYKIFDNLIGILSKNTKVDFVIDVDSVNLL